MDDTPHDPQPPPAAVARRSGRPAAGSPAGEARRRLLEATLELVGTDGIAAVTNRRVAARADVSLGSLTYHFSSQAELLRAALLLQVEREVTRIEAITDRIGAADVPLTALLAEGAELVRAADAEPAALAELELYLGAARDPELRDAVARSFAAYDALAATALGALGIPDDGTRAPLVVAMLNGLALRRLALGEPDRGELAEALTVLVRGLVPPP